MATILFSGGFGGSPFGVVGHASTYGTLTVSEATASVAGGSSGGKRKYIVRKDGQLLVFAKARDAYKVLDDIEADEKQELPRVVKSAKKAPKPVEVEAESPELIEDEPDAVQVAPSGMQPLAVLDIEWIRELARRHHQARLAKELIFKARYTALLELVARLQDEEDVEMLLLLAS